MGVGWSGSGDWKEERRNERKGTWGLRNTTMGRVCTFSRVCDGERNGGEGISVLDLRTV